VDLNLPVGSGESIGVYYTWRQPDVHVGENRYTAGAQFATRSDQNTFLSPQIVSGGLAYGFGRVDGQPGLVAADLSDIFGGAGDSTLIMSGGHVATDYAHSSGRVSVGEDGTLYVQVEGVLYAVDPDNGSVLWSVDGDFQYRVPAAGNSGNVYMIGATGEINAITPDGTVAWTSSIIDAGFVSARRELNFGALGTLYTVYDNTIVAIFSDSTGPADSDWPVYGANPQRTFVVEVR
jgi:outer membrane protein assembly factor BamB